MAAKVKIEKQPTKAQDRVLPENPHEKPHDAASREPRHSSHDINGRQSQSGINKAEPLDEPSSGPRPPAEDETEAMKEKSAQIIFFDFETWSLVKEKDGEKRSWSQSPW